MDLDDGRAFNLVGDAPGSTHVVLSHDAGRVLVGWDQPERGEHATFRIRDTADGRTLQRAQVPKGHMALSWDDEGILFADILADSGGQPPAGRWNPDDKSRGFQPCAFDVRAPGGRYRVTPTRGALAILERGTPARFFRGATPNERVALRSAWEHGGPRWIADGRFVFGREPAFALNLETLGLRLVLPPNESPARIASISPDGRALIARRGASWSWGEVSYQSG